MDIDFPCEVETGGIIGVVELVDCVEGHKSPWAMDGCYHWLLENPRSAPFVPMQGLRIFNVKVAARGRGERREQRIAAPPPDRPFVQAPGRTT
jgi:hypothetical protein